MSAVIQKITSWILERFSGFNLIIAIAAIVFIVLYWWISGTKREERKKLLKRLIPVGLIILVASITISIRELFFASPKMFSEVRAETTLQNEKNKEKINLKKIDTSKDLEHTNVPKKIEDIRPKIREEKPAREKVKEQKNALIISKIKTFKEGFINSIITNNPDRVDIAVLVLEKDSKDLSQSSRETGDRIGQKLTKENIKAVSNLFNNKFIEEGNFENLYQGDIKVIFDLELNNHVDYIILGTKEASFFQDPRLGDLVSCTIYLDLKIYSTKTGEIISSNSFNVAGIGIDEKDAEQKAIDRIANKAENFIIIKIKNQRL